MRWALLLCAVALAGGLRAEARDEGPQLGTLAYVVSECRVDTQRRFTGRQRLVIARGTKPPITVLEAESGAPVDDTFNACASFGDNRFGPLALLVGVFHRLAVRPGGDAIVFEVNAALSFTPIGLTPTAPIEPGFYYVRADGSGLRRLGPPSNLEDYVTFPDPSPSAGSPGIAVDVLADLYWSPDGRTLAFTDEDPGGALQVWTLDVASGARRQVTTLPNTANHPPSQIETRAGAFVDRNTLAFSTYAFGGPQAALFTIDVDGTHQRRLPDPVSEPGSHVIPSFAVIGERSRVVTMELPRPGENMDEGTTNVHEVFLVEKTGLVQLSTFGRVDTVAQALTSRRVVLTGSADPLALNGDHACQLFSVSRGGGASTVRQLTAFRGRGGDHCTFGTPECYISPVFRDAAHRSLIFMSSCEPADGNSHGAQVFLMDEAGRSLRQLTNLAGFVFEPDGSQRVELPGPIAYAGSGRRR